MHPYDRTQQTVNYLTSETDLPADGLVVFKHPISSTAELRFENNVDSTDYSSIKHRDNYTDVDGILIIGGGTALNAIEIASRDESKLEGDAEADLCIIESDAVIHRGRYYRHVIYNTGGHGAQTATYSATGTQDAPGGLPAASKIYGWDGYAYASGTGWVREFQHIYYGNGDIELNALENGAGGSTYFRKSGSRLTWEQGAVTSLDINDGIVTAPLQSTIYGYLSANQTVNHGITTAWVAIEFDTFTRDTQSEMTSYTFTATADGVYSVTLTVSAGYTGSIAYQQIGFNLNGTMSKRIPMYRIVGTAYAHLSDNISLSAGDSLYFALQYSATAVDTFDINSGPNSSFCSIVKLM